MKTATDLFAILAPLVFFAIQLKYQRLRRRGELSRIPSFHRNVFFEWETKWEKGYLPIPYIQSQLFYVDRIIEWRTRTALPDIADGIRMRYMNRGENFDLFEPLDLADVPENRLPANGITILPYRYHTISMRDMEIGKIPRGLSDTITPEGHPVHPEIMHLLTTEFPSFRWFIDYYCRPTADGNAAFASFNAHTYPVPDVDPERKKHVLSLMKTKFNVRAHRMLHFVDALSSRAPYSTSADYFHKFDPNTRARARHTCPARYRDRPTSKGYFVNTFLVEARTIVHYVKETGFPFSTFGLTDTQKIDHLNSYFLRRPTQLFIRTQISERDRPGVESQLKVRPVYNAPPDLLHLEKMISLCYLMQLRNKDCCVMHGLETFRGAMQWIDLKALSFSSYFGLDWKNFDQLMPFCIVKIYFQDWLESFLYVNGGYAPVVDYKSHNLSSADMFSRITNILWFLQMWYINMVYLSYDGYAYRRRNAGVPSGVLNTNSFGCFGNLFIQIDGMIEFGFSDQEILETCFFIMGDDSLDFLKVDIARLLFFAEWFEAYAFLRYGMKMSKTKSLITTLRDRIEVLSYTNNFGMPIRPLGKLLCLIVYPERLPKPGMDWIRAAAAIGGAYAACGMDPTLHLFFQKVYEKFKPERPITRSEMKKYSTYFISELLSEDESIITFDRFPTIEEVRANVRTYKGPLTESDHWNFKIFTQAPSDPYFLGETVLEYRTRNNIPYRKIPFL